MTRAGAGWRGPWSTRVRTGAQRGEESRAACEQWGGGLGVRPLSLLGHGPVKGKLNIGLFLTTLRGSLCSILLGISLQMILCECKKRWLNGTPTSSPFFCLENYGHFCHFLSWDSILSVLINLEKKLCWLESISGEESISLANLRTLLWWRELI